MKNDLLHTARVAVKNWWISLLVGVLSIVLGVLFIAYPVDGFATLSIMFVISFFVAGLLEIIFSISNRHSIDGWGWTLASGIIDILFGVLLLYIPLSTPFIMIYFVGFWIMFQSVWGIGVSCDLQRAGVPDWGWLLALAILGLIFSFVFLMSPIYYTSGFVLALAAVGFIVYGIFRIYLSSKLKSFKNKVSDLEKQVNQFEQNWTANNQ